MAVVVVAPRARAQLRRAVAFWERERPDERSRLADEMARALELLAEFPDLGVGIGRRDRRRLLLPMSAITSTMCTGESASRSSPCGMPAEGVCRDDLCCRSVRVPDIARISSELIRTSR